MDLSAPQRDRLNRAMVEVFTDYRHLKRFMSNKLDFNVATEVESTNLNDAVFEIIERFEPENREETDLRRLLVALHDGFPANRILGELTTELGITESDMQAIRFEMRQADDHQARTDHAPDRIRRELRPESQGQDTSRTRIPTYTSPQSSAESRRESVRRYTQRGKQEGQPAKRPVSRRKITEMLSALSTLERLREEFDRALNDFVNTHAEGVQPDFEEGSTAEEVLDHVRMHAEMIHLSDEPAETRQMLSQLLIDVQAAIEIAERHGRYEIVRELSKEAGNSCQRAAQGAISDERLVLLSVVPYWRMREAYAEHQPKIPSSAR